MEPSELARATAAATSVAATLGLPADDAIVLNNSNRLALRLTPCDVVARVAHVCHDGAQLEVDLAERLGEAGCPTGTLADGVDPRVYFHDDFVVTLWTYYEPVPTPVSPVGYATALAQLHADMRTFDLPSPSFRDRIAEAEELVADPDRSPALADSDRQLLNNTLVDVRQMIEDRDAEEQLLHGEPHPGNVLNTANGPIIIDFETCCRGPVEFDLAYVPQAVAAHYPGADQGLLDECRRLVLAMVAAWRWELGDQFPNRKAFGAEFLRSLLAGPPWPTLDAVTSQLDAR